jgi:signal-transduction protein with cAMP-binding, CBS, and nucleotidyltransferase domain
MYVARDLHPEFKVMDERSRLLLDEILAGVPSRDVEFLARTHLLEGHQHNPKVYRIHDGVVSEKRHGVTLWHLEAGDMFGFDLHFWWWDVVLSAEHVVKCGEYEIEEILSAVASSPDLMRKWSEYLVLQSVLTQSLLSITMHDEVETAPTIRTYRAGEAIVTQGDRAEEVFTLAEGHADVLVDGVKVGEILRDEIFGVLAAVGGGTRTATVVASRNSLVLSLPCEQFAQLVQSRPRLVVKFIEDVARATAAMNLKLVNQK